MKKFEKCSHNFPTICIFHKLLKDFFPCSEHDMLDGFSIYIGILLVLSSLYQLIQVIFPAILVTECRGCLSHMVLWVLWNSMDLRNSTTTSSLLMAIIFVIPIALGSRNMGSSPLHTRTKDCLFPRK